MLNRRRRDIAGVSSTGECKILHVTSTALILLRLPARPPQPLLRRAFAFLGLLALVLASALSTGCASKPTMKLKAAEISGMTLGFPLQVGVVMTMVIDAYNPNSYDVAIRAMRGMALLADKYTLPIDYRPGPEGVWLASKAKTTMRVPVSVPVDLALRLLRESDMAPTVPFRVTGTADVTATRAFQIEEDNYSFDETGTFTRQQLELAIPHF